MPSSTKNHPTRIPLKSGVFEIFLFLFFLAMAKVVNSFALLGDEEEDDVTVLVEHFTKKVGVTTAVAAAKSKKKPSQDQSQQVSSEQGKGHGGHGRGSGRDGVGKKEGQFGNEQENSYRRKYTERSNGNGYDNAYRGRGRGRGGNRGREGNGRTTEVDSDGWQQVGHAHVRGYVNKTNNNWSEERPFRNGNRNYGGERRGYRYANHGYGGRHDGMDNAGDEQVKNNEVKENIVRADPVVNVESNIAISEGDAAPVTVEPTEVRAEEKTPEGSVKSEGRVKADKPFKKFEKEDEKLMMTLEEYQKVFAEKRKALESLKNEERKVAADRGFEAMEMVAKKKEEALLKPESAKLKKKDSLEKDEKSRKTLSINEFLKPADGEKFFYRRPGRGRVNGGVSGDFRNGDPAEQGGGFRNRDRSQQGGFSIANCAEQGRGFRNRDRSQQGEFSNVNRAKQGEFKSKDPAEQGGGFRNRDRSQQGGFSNANRAEQGGGFRNRDRAEQGEFSNGNRAEQGEFKSKDRAEQGESKSKDRRAEDKPVIDFEDQSQFPVLKGIAPAV